MIELVKSALQTIIDSLDAGHTNLSETECEELLSYIAKVTDKQEKLSKEQAIFYITKHINKKISRATFDNYVRNGLIPKGRDQMGFKEKFWIKSDLQDFIKQYKS